MTSASEQRFRPYSNSLRLLGHGLSLRDLNPDALAHVQLSLDVGDVGYIREDRFNALFKIPTAQDAGEDDGCDPDGFDEFLIFTGSHTSSSSSLKRQQRNQDLESLNPTLSSWLDNMRRLSALVDQVHELARSAPVQHRKPILSRVAELRAAYKKQQERCIDFLQLTQEYADRYLADISDEVRSQGAVLRALEQRLRMAKDLRAEVINLQNAFEKWTCGQLKSVRKSVLSIAIPDDVKLVEEMDKILKIIKMCYKELDKFWIGEVRRVTKAVKTCRMNKEDLDQWNSFQKALSEASGIDEGDTFTPQGMNAVLLHNQRIPPTSLGTPDTLQAPTFDTDSTAAHMHILPALSSARTALHTLYLTQSTIAHDSRLLLAGLHIEKNQNSYAGFLRNCSSYGRTVVSMAVAFIQHRSFARSKSMHDRQVRGSAIMARAHPFPRTENGLAANFRGATRVFHDIDTVLRKTAQAWDVLCTQHNTVFARVLALDEPETYLGACSIKQLSHVMRMWAKEGNVLRGAAARLCT